MLDKVVTGPLQGIRRDVLMVEDHPLVAQATISLLCDVYADIHPVVVTTATAALNAAAPHWFRIFIDLDVPGAQGLSLLHAFKARGLIQRCCVITAIRGTHLVDEARQLGALGYIEKSSPVRLFCQALRDVMHGVRVFPDTGAAAAVTTQQLTLRQLAVLRMLQRGLSSKQIAYELNIAEGTAKNHTFAVLQALNANNRAHAVARGIELGLLPATRTPHNEIVEPVLLPDLAVDHR